MTRLLRLRVSRLLCAALLASALTACAHYAAMPLRDPLAVLGAPDLALLSADAQKIDRPYLTPQAIDLTRPLTPNQLGILAVLENADLKALRVKNGVTDAQAFAARLLPDPSAQANFDKILSGPDVFNAYGAQLGFDLNLLRTRGVTRASGQASRRQVRLDLAWAEWQAAGLARLLGVRVLALTDQLGIARVSAAAAQRLFEATARASGRGDLAASDLDVRRQASLDAADRLRITERDLVAARGDLNKQVGLPPDMLLKLASGAPPPEVPAASVLTTQALTRRLDLQALRAGYEVGEAGLHVAVLEQFPNLSLTIAGARDTADNKTLGPAIGFSLPLWNRNRGNIAVARATREQLRAEYEARLFQTRADIGAGVAGIAAARGQRTALTEQLPALRRYVDATNRAAARGDLAPATADVAQQALRDRMLTLAQLDQQIAEQVIALELLSGSTTEGWTR